MMQLQDTLNNIEPADKSYSERARDRLDQLTMPHWALGQLMDLAVELAAMTRSMAPPIKQRTVVTMAGDHGVVAEGVSKYPQEVTVQMVHNFVNQGAGINALSRVANAEVRIVDMGVAGDLTSLAQAGSIISAPVASGTSNMAEGPAMTKEQALEAIHTGIEIANELAYDTDVFGTGDMGIGNTTPSSAIVSAITGASPADVTGRGTGIDEEGLEHKIQVIEQALDVNSVDPTDGIDVLSKVGGFEIGGLAGLILGAAQHRKPILIDGLISTAAALIAHLLAPASADYMIAAHLSVECGHEIMLDHLGKQPLLDLDLRLGEGTGAAAAMPLLECAARTLTDIATFEEAKVSSSDSDEPETT